MNADWIIPDWPAPASVRALATTRIGQSGESSLGSGGPDEPYGNFNLATHVGDNLQAVTANRQRLRCEAPGLPADPLWLNQVHGTRVLVAESDRQGVAPEADACIARMPGQVCAVLRTDCLPLLLCDAQGSVVAAAHAGWRGLAAGVIESTVAAMRIEPARLLAWLGPAIGPTAFEVGDEVRNVFCRHDPRAAGAFVAHGPGKWLCDLYLLARQRLAALEVKRVSGGKWCTYSDARRFYSYRRDGVTGRMATLVWLE